MLLKVLQETLRTLGKLRCHRKSCALLILKPLQVHITSYLPGQSTDVSAH